MKTIFLILIGVHIITSCADKTIQEEKSTENIIDYTVTLTSAQFKNANIQIGKLEKREISTTLTLNGKIDVPPQNIISVSTPFGGFLKST